jgi:hypothetical protein
MITRANHLFLPHQKTRAKPGFFSFASCGLDDSAYAIGSQTNAGQ